MKALSFFIGFMIVYAGAGAKVHTPLWAVAIICFIGLGFMWWGVLPRATNRYKK